LEAAREIARQLRLRALSGLIVADFLELAGKAERKRFDAGLQEAFSGDPEPHQLQPLRASGLLEMTRRRSRPALHEILTEPCGLGGGGRRATALTDAFRALRALQAAALEGPGGRPGLRLAPRVEQALQGEAAAALAALAGRLGYDPVLQQANGLADFEVVTEPRR
jgi:Ribonuclease G/E